MDEIPQIVNHKKLDFAVEDLADYLSVNCADNYEAIILFGKYRFLQGKYEQIGLDKKTIDNLFESLATKEKP